jgi:hypothetical protein
MATQADVRRLALALPDTVEATNDFAFSVLVKGKAKGFAWVWKERIDPKKGRVPNPKMIAIRVANNAVKDFMMTNEPDKFVFDPHYNGYAAVIVRLAKVRVPELRELLTEGYNSLIPTPRRKKG